MLINARLTVLHLTRCLHIAKTLESSLIEKHGCGWFDGGCFTLASAVSSVVPGTDIYHISRCENIYDHAVIKIDGVDLYFDADGVATDGALFKKMKDKELTDATVLAKVSDSELAKTHVFEDIKRDFIRQYRALEKINVGNISQ